MRQPNFQSALLVLAMTLASKVSAAVTISSGPAVEWRGERLKAKEGVAYFVPVLRGLTSGSATGRINVWFKSQSENRVYILSNTVPTIEGSYRELWKLPMGQYEVERIELPTDSGKVREWRSKTGEKQMFFVPRLTLANMGQWTLSANGKNRLAVKFEDIPSTFKDNRPKEESSISGVVSAYTGKIQETFAGKKLFEQSKSTQTEEGVLDVVSTTSRQISLFYNLDLIRHNRYMRQVIDALNIFDGKLRSCYLRRLNGDATLRGTIDFKILISKQTGTIRKARRSGGTLPDNSVVECLIEELQQIPIPVQVNMVGELKLTFDVR